MALVANLKLLYSSDARVIFSILPVFYCRVIESVGEVVSTILGRMKWFRGIIFIVACFSGGDQRESYPSAFCHQLREI